MAQRQKSTYQLRQLIDNKLDVMQKQKQKGEDVNEYYREKLAPLTSEKFRDVITTTGKSEKLKLSKKPQSREDLEHILNILNKAKIPSKLSNKEIQKIIMQKNFENNLSIMYEVFTESEVHKLLPLDDRDEYGRLSQKAYKEISDWQKNNTIQQAKAEVEDVLFT